MYRAEVLAKSVIKENKRFLKMNDMVFVEKALVRNEMDIDRRTLIRSCEGRCKRTKGFGYLDYIVSGCGAGRFAFFVP